MSHLSSLSHPNPSEGDLDSVIDVFIQPVSNDEIAELTQVLADSGSTLPRPRSHATDVASTGSPGSLTTVLAPLFCAAAGWQVRKITVPGRPAGSVDAFSIIDGYCADIDLGAAEVVLARSRYVQLLAGTRWTPLDARLFARRQTRGAQGVEPLVIASILAKKLAAGLNCFALDVRAAPYGNFGSNRAEASERADRLISVAELVGIRAVCSVSDALSVAQPYIGRGEALLALDLILSGATLDDWLGGHAVACQHLARLATEDASIPPAQVTLDTLLSHLATQGAAEDAWARTLNRIRGEPAFDIVAPAEGRVAVDMVAVRDAITSAQRASPFTDPVGVVLRQRPGALVERGDILATVRVANGSAEFLERFRAAIRVAEGE